MNSVNQFEKKNSLFLSLSCSLLHMEKNQNSREIEEAKENIPFDFITYSTINRHSNVAILKFSGFKWVEQNVFQWFPSVGSSFMNQDANSDLSEIKVSLTLSPIFVLCLVAYYLRSLFRWDCNVKIVIRIKFGTNLFPFFFVAIQTTNKNHCAFIGK